MMKNLKFVVGGLLLSVLLLAGCSQQGKIDRHLKKGNQHFEAGRYEEATIEYLNVLQQDRSNVVAIVRSGLAHFELGNVQQAAVMLREGVKLVPDDLEARQKLGTIYRLARMIPEAREEALAILERDPDNFDALMLLVDTSYQPEEVADLEARLVERAGLFGDRPTYHLAMAQVHLRKRSAEAAEASLNRALELGPEDVMVLEALADFHAGLNHEDQAEEFLSRAAELAKPVSQTRVKWAGLRYAKGEKEAALQDLREMVTEEPGFLPAWEQLGEYALRDGRIDDGQEAASAILAVNPEHVSGRLLQARVWLVQGESAKAVEAFEKLSEQNQESGMLRHQLGMAYLRDGKIDQAKPELRAAYELDPRLIPAALQLAELNLRTGEAATAARDLEALIEERGASPEVAMILARAYLANEEPDRAIAVFRQLEEMQPESHVGAYLRGEVLLQQNKNQEAREAYEAAQQRAPDLVAIVTRLAILDLREDHPDAAIARVKAAIEKSPGQAGLHQMLGVIYAQTEQADLAEQAFRKEIEVNPKGMQAYLSLTKLLVQLDRVDEALAQVEEGLAVEPDNIQTLMLSGMFLEKKGDYTRALERYNRLIELEPRFAQPVNNAAYIYAVQLGDLDKAFALAKTARELAPKDAAIADTLGWIAYQRGDHPWALTLILEGAEGYPDNPEVLYHVGVAQLAMGNEAKALEALTRAAELGQDSLDNLEQVRALGALLAVPVEQVTPANQALIDAVLATDAQNPAARVRQAALVEQGNNRAAWEEAKPMYQAILTSHPQFLPATLRLIDLYDVGLQDRARALDLVRQARTTRPEDPEIGKRGGWLALRTGDYPWAYSLLQESARALPEDPAVQYHLAVATYYAGKAAEAERLAEATVKSAGADAPEMVDAERFLALATAAAGEAVSPEALTLARQVAEEDPLHVPAQMVVARAREQAGDGAGAVAVYTDVLQYVPSFGPAAREAARLYAEVLNDSDQAYPLAAQAREAMPQDDEAARILGTLAYQREDYGYAARLLEQALRAQPDQADTLYLLGFCRQQLGDPAGAREALERALQLAPDSPRAAQATEALAALQ